jgi:hypothetical protein
MTDCSKSCLIIFSILLFGISINIIINGEFYGRGLYISGIHAYTIAVLQIILGFVML